MKLIIATIPTENWEDVRAVLKSNGAHTMYLSSVGDLQDSLLVSYRGANYSEPRKRTRLEIVVMNDLEVRDVVETLNQFACLHKLQRQAAGSIFVVPLDDWTTIPNQRQKQWTNTEDAALAGAKLS